MSLATYHYYEVLPSSEHDNYAFLLAFTFLIVPSCVEKSLSSVRPYLLTLPNRRFTKSLLQKEQRGEHFVVREMLYFTLRRKINETNL